MSWLKIPSNTHQHSSENMEATESEDIVCTRTLTTSSNTLSTTVATASFSSNTAGNSDVTGAQITTRPLPSPSGSYSTSASTPRPPPHSSSNGENHSAKDHQSTAGTQVHARNEIVDQPMTETEPRNNSSPSDDFLNVSLDLDAASLQQLLALSRSPESHQSSRSNQKSSHFTDSTVVAPLSPISQLFDRLEEPARLTGPGAQLNPSDSCIPNGIHERSYTEENPGHSHTDVNSHAHLNVSVDAQSSVANQDITSFNVNSSQVEVPGLAQGNIADVSSTWTPSPNSLQLWLESTSGKLLSVKHTCICQVTIEILGSYHTLYE